MGCIRQRTVAEESDGPSFDRNAWSTELEALEQLTEEVYTRACDNEDYQERGQVWRQGSRSLRRATESGGRMPGPPTTDRVKETFNTEWIRHRH